MAMMVRVTTIFMVFLEVILMVVNGDGCDYDAERKKYDGNQITFMMMSYEKWHGVHDLQKGAQCEENPAPNKSVESTYLDLISSISSFFYDWIFRFATLTHI